MYEIGLHCQILFITRMTLACIDKLEFDNANQSNSNYNLTMQDNQILVVYLWRWFALSNSIRCPYKICLHDHKTMSIFYLLSTIFCMYLLMIASSLYSFVILLWPTLSVFYDFCSATCHCRHNMSSSICKQDFFNCRIIVICSDKQSFFFSSM